MKLHRLYLPVLCIGFFIQASAQLPKLNELNLPSSPAFVLLGQSPATIEKPTNPKALGLNLINVWRGSGAVEFTPYWLMDHDSYTFKQDVLNRKPFWQTFAISVASSKIDSISSLAVGFRVQLYRRYTDEQDILNVRKKIIDLLVTLPIDENAIKEQLKILNEKRAQVKWNVELAGAYAGDGTTTKDLSANKSGFWINIRHTPKNSPVDLVALVRYTSTIGNKTKTTPDSTYFDYGISISRQKKDFDLHLEYVKRRDMVLNTTYDRLVFVANYEVAPGIVFVTSAGKDFGIVNNVITTFGIKFGMSNQKVN